MYNYADIIDMTYLFFGICKKYLMTFRINQKFDNIPRNNTNIDFF